MSQNRSPAVMAQRAEPPDSLDFFPTPPWATRALCEWIGSTETLASTCLEPACGEGHMARELARWFDNAFAGDVFDYRYEGADRIEDFLMPGAWTDQSIDWVVTNPPFRLASEFARVALDRAERGVALLVRTVFLEGGDRWRSLFRSYAPSDVLIFSERVPMLKGRLDRKASSATSYCWMVWRKYDWHETRLHWIPPGTRKRLERDEDYA